MLASSLSGNMLPLPSSSPCSVMLPFLSFGKHFSYPPYPSSVIVYASSPCSVKRKQTIALTLWAPRTTNDNLCNARRFKRECPWTSCPREKRTTPTAHAWGRCSAGRGRSPSAGTTTPLRCSAMQGSLQGRADPLVVFFTLAGSLEEAFGFRASRGVRRQTSPNVDQLNKIFSSNVR